MSTSVRRTHGMSPEQWNAVVEEIRAVLIDIARNQGLITYSDLFAQLKSASLRPHGPHVGDLLEDASMPTSNVPYLSALVVDKHTNVPSHGFFIMAKKFGRDVQNETAFWSAEVAAVYEHWRGQR